MLFLVFLSDGTVFSTLGETAVFWLFLEDDPDLHPHNTIKIMHINIPNVLIILISYNKT
jgi:hypothetical protein